VITPKVLSVVDARIIPKIYDGSASAEISEVIFSGLVGVTESSSEVTESSSGVSVGVNKLSIGIDYLASGTFTDATQGTGKSVTIDLRLLPTPLSANYTLSNARHTPLNLTIYASSLSPDLLRFTPSEAMYDGTPKPVTILPVDGVPPLLTPYTIYYNGVPSPPVEIGSYTITVGVLPSPTLSANIVQPATLPTLVELGTFRIYSPRPPLSSFKYSIKKRGL
jgi:hypothetical protein